MTHELAAGDVAAVRGWAARWAGGRRLDPDDAAGYALEAALRLAAAWRPHGGMAWAPYLWALLERRTIDLLRRHEYDPRLVHPRPLDVDVDVELEADPRAEHDLELAERRAALPAVLAELHRCRPTLAAVLVESYLHGVPLAEIGRRRGRTESWASYRRTEALALARRLAA